VSPNNKPDVDTARFCVTKPGIYENFLHILFRISEIDLSFFFCEIEDNVREFDVQVTVHNKTN